MSNPQFDEECQKAEAEKAARKKPLSTKEAFAQWWEKHGKPPHGVSTSYSQDFAFQCAFNAGTQHQENVQIAALVDIREAIGDKDGRLMSEEVVARVRELQAEVSSMQELRKKWGGDTFGHLPIAQAFDAYCDTQAGKVAELEAENARLMAHVRDVIQDMKVCSANLIDTIKSPLARPEHERYREGMEHARSVLMHRFNTSMEYYGLANHIVDANKMVSVELDDKGRPTKAGGYEFRGRINGGEWFSDQNLDFWIKVEIWHNEESGRLNVKIFDADGNYGGNMPLVAFNGEWRKEEA